MSTGRNIFYLQGDPGNPIFVGTTTIIYGAWTANPIGYPNPPDLSFGISPSGGGPNDFWTLEFESDPSGKVPLVEQTYADAGSSPVGLNPVLNVSGPLGCNAMTGSFTIYHVDTSDAGLVFLGTFEEDTCDGNTAPLRGCLAYSSANPLDACPPPADAGDPGPIAQCLDAGNWLYLEGTRGSGGAFFNGDAGAAVLWAPSTQSSTSFEQLDFSSADPTLSSGSIALSLEGLGLPLQTGLYTANSNLAGSPCLAGLSLAVNGAQCTLQSGTFAIDALTPGDAGLSFLLASFAADCQTDGQVRGCLSFDPSGQAGTTGGTSSGGTMGSTSGSSTTGGAAGPPGVSPLVVSSVDLTSLQVGDFFSHVASAALFLPSDAGVCPPPNVASGSCCFQNTGAVRPASVSAGTLTLTDNGSMTIGALVFDGGYPIQQSISGWQDGDLLGVSAPGATLAGFTGTVIAPGPLSDVTPAIGQGIALSTAVDFTVTWDAGAAGGAGGGGTDGGLDGGVDAGMDAGPPGMVFIDIILDNGQQIYCSVDDTAGALVIPAASLGLLSDAGPGQIGVIQLIHRTKAPTSIPSVSLSADYWIHDTIYFQ